ncbi:T6SS phospholipase effector Tle1-like catalytic domain-containing protein [Pseudoalteromonas piscicida]|uniref:T6SS phospholipase effector Tle1-like catalytic domain-containing protein n=1 Tax=Pseudoalteromonas piscicida TaxID=43662 RepID=UPI003C7EC68D
MKIVEEKHNWLIDQQIDELEVLPPHTTTAHLPSEIRTQLKPHASDWIVLQQRHNWRHVKRDEFTRVFIKTKKGLQSVRSGSAAGSREQLIIVKRKSYFKAVIRNNAFTSSGGVDPNQPIGASQLDPLTPVEQVLASINVDKSPEVAEKRILVSLEGELAVSFVIQGANTPTLSRASEGATQTPLIFGKLSEDGRYSLKAKILGVPEQVLFNNVPYADLLDIEKVKALKIGADGGVQLIKHRVSDEGNVHLYFISEPPSIGIFFDGTGNNKYNDILDPFDDKEPTNIAKLHELYDTGKKFVFSEYIEGVGTAAGKKDSIIDLAVAYSFDERLLKALASIFESIDTNELILVNTVLLDCFGFSRGAAAARAFVNLVNEMREAQDIRLVGKEVVFRFVGIFDTVASIGGDGDNDHSELYARDELDDAARLDLNQASAGAVYHLTAWDERRDKFPLSSLKNKDGSLFANHKEDHLPGVHSDIGGGYAPISIDIEYPLKRIRGIPGNPEHEAKVQQAKLAIERQYQWPGINVDMVYRFKRLRYGASRSGRDKDFYTTYRPVWRRKIDNTLAHYGLHQMYNEAIQHGVPLKEMARLQSIYPYELSHEVTTLVPKALKAGPASQAWQKLYEHYIHISSRFTGAADKLAHGAERKAKYVTENGQREMFYNNGLKLPKVDIWTSFRVGGKVVWRKG